MSEQEPKIQRRVLLDQIAKNLRPYSEMVKLADRSKNILMHMQETGFKLMIKDLNRIFKTNAFTKNDFIGAKVNPDNLKSAEYQKLYGLVPVIPSIGIDEDQWREFFQKFDYGLPNESPKQTNSTEFSATVSKFDFERNFWDLETDTYGLKGLGLHFYIKQDNDMFRQGNTLSMDSWNFANHKNNFDGYNEEASEHPLYDRLCMEHKLIEDICWNLTHGDVVQKYWIKALTNAAETHCKDLLTQYDEMFEPEEDDTDEFDDGCDEDKKIIQAKIIKIVPALDRLEQRIGRSTLLPIIYAMGRRLSGMDGFQPSSGATDRDAKLIYTAKRRILSPLNNIVLLDKYVNRGVESHWITEQDLVQRLSSKGYDSADIHSFNL